MRGSPTAVLCSCYIGIQIGTVNFNSEIPLPVNKSFLKMAGETGCDSAE
jgi:hypothetical protein